MATKFSLTDPNPGAWFKFNEDDPESGKIRIRALNIEHRNEIRKQCVKSRVDYRKGQRFEYDKVDEEMFSRLLWDYCIAEWVALEDDDGKSLLCDTDTKFDLMTRNPRFATFINACMEKVAEDDITIQEELEKNSLPGLKDSGKSRPVKSVGS